jgi:capsular exopolysaccharide synthesis family protein
MNVVVPSRQTVAPRVSVTPVTDEVASDRIAEQLVSFNAPHSIAADRYRGLRYTLEGLRKESGFQVIAVTSPSPGDGKTVTTLNLAGAFAQAQGARALVIDADLRKPSVAAYLGVDDRRSPGLSHALRDARYQLGDIVRHLKGFNLWVVTAGAPEPSPYELLTSSRLDVLLRDARRDYDCVLIDTPPSVLLPDCRLIERWVDGLLVVVAAHKTPRTMLTEALNELDPAKVLGVVFNADDRPSARYHGYYGYYNTGSSPSTPRRARWWRRLFGKP